MLLTDAELAAGMSLIVAATTASGKPSFTIDRTVVVNMLQTPVKYSKGKMLLNIMYVVVFHNRDRKGEVSVHLADSKEKLTQLWTSRFISKSEHKVSLSHFTL